MSYAGNSSLALEVRQRILSTFRQTLDLASSGSVQEAKLGCDFILRMDPDFQPARTLLDRLEGAEGAVPIDDLRSDGDGTAAGVALDEPSADDLFSELEELDLDDSLSLTDPVAFGAPVAAPSLVGVLEDRLRQRDFAGVLDLSKGAESYPEIAGLVEVARSRQEAVPYIQRFLESVRTAAAEGDWITARAHLDKAISLDPTHPGVIEQQEQLPSTPGALPDIDAPSEPIPDPGSATPPGLAGPHEVAPTSETGDRIGQLLADGQGAFDSGDYQGAIDAWSRIFLIDVDHAEASERIEEARRLKAEHERQVEEVFHDALTRMESGDRAGARTGFERVLEMQPSHLAAREQLDELSGPAAMTAGPPPVVPSPAASAPAGDLTTGAAPAPGTSFDGPLTPVGEGSGTAWDLKEKIMVPPEPGEEVAGTAEPPPKPVAASRRPGKRFLLIGSLVLVMVLAALAFFYLNRDRFFPNSQETEAVAGGDPIARATGLYERGRIELALNLLRGIPNGTPRYEEAQALISQWEAAVEPDPEEGAEEEGPSAEDMVARAQLLNEARQAFADQRYLEAQVLFGEAGGISPLVEPETTLQAETEEILEPLAPQIRLFREGEYEYALPDLWRLREDKPDDIVIERLIIDCYYNLAVSDLQRNDAESAIEKLREVLDLDPDDRVATRHMAFAETYTRRNKDLLYRIYVKYLPRR